MNKGWLDEYIPKLNYTSFRINELMNQEDMGKELEEAIKILQKYLSEDKSEGSYYHSWQANIAVQFQDEVHRIKRKRDVGYLTKNDIHKISNEAAKNFLDLLIKNQ